MTGDDIIVERGSKTPWVFKAVTRPFTGKTVYYCKQRTHTYRLFVDQFEFCGKPCWIGRLHDCKWVTVETDIGATAVRFPFGRYLFEA